MDKRVKIAIESHEDYARLSQSFPLDFVIGCLDNLRRGPPARAIGQILRETAENPSLFIHGIRYHELCELEAFRKLGYVDAQLGENHSEDPNMDIVCTIAKRKELSLINYVGMTSLELELPALSIVFASTAPGADYHYPAPPFDDFYRSIRQRVQMGMTEYEAPFTIENVHDAIRLFGLGGDRCSGRYVSLSLAKRYLARETPEPRVEPWMLL